MFDVSEGSGASRVTIQILSSVDVHRWTKKNKHFRDGLRPSHLGDFHRVLGGAAGVVLHLVPLDDLFKPAEGKEKRGGGEATNLEVNLLLKPKKK